MVFHLPILLWSKALNFRVNTFGPWKILTHVQLSPVSDTFLRKIKSCSLHEWLILFIYFFFTVPLSIPHFCLYIQWGIAFLTVLSVYKIVLQSGRIDGCSSSARLKWFYLLYYFIVVFESSRETNQTGLKRCPGIRSRLNFIVLPTSFFVLSERPLVDKAPAGTKDYSCCTFLFINFLSNTTTKLHTLSLVCCIIHAMKGLPVLGLCNNCIKNELWWLC